MGSRAAERTDPTASSAAVSPAAGHQRLGDQLQVGVAGHGRSGIGGVAGRGRLVEDRVGAGADGLLGVEGPVEVPLAVAGEYVDGQHGAVVVDQRADLQAAGGGGDGAGQLGVPQVEPPVDAGDRADGLQREVADGQAGQAEQRAVLGTVVLDLAVLHVEAHGVGVLLRVDAGAEETVAQERTLVPGPRHPLPHQVGLGQEALPVDLVAEQRGTAQAAERAPGQDAPGLQQVSPIHRVPLIVDRSDVLGTHDGISAPDHGQDPVKIRASQSCNRLPLGVDVMLRPN